MEEKEKNPLVSVIIPAYNVESYLEECIDSIRKQTYQKLEIILVDDGSTDGTGERCDWAAASDSRITVIHQKNMGVVSARQAGIRIAHGTYLSFVDGDDWIEPDMIEELVRQMDSADLISAGVFREMLPGNVIKQIDQFQEGIYKGKEAMTFLYERMIYNQEQECLQPLTPGVCNKLFVRSKVEAIHERIDRELIFAEDSVFLYQYMLECESIVICHRCFYHYRYREGSAMHKANEQMLADINRVYLVFIDIFRRHWMRKELLFQLQMWVVASICIAINERLGFDDRTRIPEFVANFDGLEAKKLVLYGAGRVGQDTYRQLKAFSYEVVLWVDKSYHYYQKKGLEVKSPDEIKSNEYDKIFIAIEEKRVADEIQSSLVSQGISEKNILWKKPMKLY